MQNLFVIARKEDRVVLELKREAESPEDMQPLFDALNNLLETTNDNAPRLCIFVDTSIIDLSPTSIRMNVVKSMYYYS